MSERRTRHPSRRACAHLSAAQQALLHRIIGRAAPPHERGACAYFAPTGDGHEKRIDLLARQWQKSVAEDDPDHFRTYLQAIGLDEEGFQAQLAEVTVRDPDVLPGWADALVSLFDGLAARAPPNVSPKRADRPTFELLDPLLEAAEQTLVRHCIAPAGIDVSASARTGMLGVLRNRFWQSLEPLLDFELRMAATNAALFDQLNAPSPPVFEHGVDAWLERLERFPAVAYLIGTSFRNWCVFMAEICRRLAADRELLGAQFFNGAAPGQLTDFRGDSGDVHAHGRAVALLTFEGGRKAVYKPKDLRCAVGFCDVVAFLNLSGLDPPLHPGRILARDAYAWEAFVEHVPCHSQDDVRRFYVRMGMLIRLLQLFEGRDFWLDNLIAHGDQPVFIDLETLLQPRLEMAGLSPSEREARKQLAESAVETGAIVMATPIEAGIGTEDLGALATPRPSLTPFRHSRSPSAPSGDRRATEQDFVTWTHPEHAPVLDGVHTDAADHLDDILVGYRTMQTCLLANRDALLAPDGPASRLPDAPVRYICRDTWSCQKLVRHSVAPPLLADPMKREIFLHQLYRPVLTGDFDGPARDRHCRIVHSEIAALRELDVPFFMSRPDSAAAFTVQDEEVAGHFDGTAWDRFRQRLLQLDTFALHRHEEMVLSCFATGHRTTRALSHRASEREKAIGSPAADGPERWIEYAVEIGNAVLDDAMGTPANDLAWLGFVYHPYIDHLSLEPLQADLLTGSCGVAMLFADLYAATNDARWRTAACSALAATLRAVDEAPAAWQELAGTAHRRSIPIHCGAFLGSGAHIYCLDYCARLLNEPHLDAAAAACLEDLPVAALLDHAGSDVVCGTAGLLLAAANSAGRKERPAADKIAHTVAASLADTPVGSDGRIAPPAFPRRTLRLDGLPDATDGFAIAVARMTTADGDCTNAPYRETLDRLLRVVFRTDDAPLTVGRLHAGLAAAATVGACLETAVSAIDRYLAATVERADTPASIDALDIALTAFQTTGQQRFHDHAARVAETLIATHASCGTWFPLSCSADRHNLSAIWGVPAIGRALLGLAAPTRWRSARTAALPAG